MNKISFRLVLALLSLTFLVVAPAEAKTKKKAPAAPAPRPTVISSVSPASITVSENNLSKTYAITQFTEVLVKGQHAKISDLQPGMAVSVTMGSDSSKAGRINASDAPR